jgi:hypothetical protein
MADHESQFQRELGQEDLPDPRESQAVHHEHPSAKEYIRIGIIWLLSLVGRSFQGRLGPENAEAVEISGLYWHFVDVVWIFIFTAIYLIPQH